MQVLPRRNRMIDRKRKLRPFWPFALRAEHSARKGGRGIQIEPFGPQRRLERGAIRRVARQGDPPFDRAAVDLGFDVVDRDAVGRHIDVTAQAKRILAAIARLVPPLQPHHQRIGVGGIRW